MQSVVNLSSKITGETQTERVLKRAKKIVSDPTHTSSLKVVNLKHIREGGSVDLFQELYTVTSAPWLLRFKMLFASVVATDCISLIL